jgi:outer membrane immunogenic protein
MNRLIVTASMILAAATGQALAADLPQPAPPPVHAPAPYFAPVYNWAGIYAGINGGYGFGSSTWSDPANSAGGGSGNFHTNGGQIGGTLGVNFQVRNLVVGVETDLDWQGEKGTSGEGNLFCAAPVTATGATGLSCNTKSDWIGTFRGRIGGAIDRLLFYATAGGAYGNVQASLSSLPTQSTTRFGWSAGAGVEAAFSQNWTAKIEYLWADLGHGASCNTAASCGFDPTGVANNSVKFTESMLRVGLNYKFNF